MNVSIVNAISAVKQLSIKKGQIPFSYHIWFVKHAIPVFSEGVLFVIIVVIILIII